MIEVDIYGAVWCDWCEKAKELAEQHNFNIRYHNVDDDGVKEAFRFYFPNVKKIPQIMINAKHVGGYEDFAKEVENMVDGSIGEGQL